MITCTFEDGGRGSLRHVTVDGILVKNSKLLLIKRASYLLEGNKWALPGGLLDRNETAEEGVRREIREESGYDVSKLVLFIINSYPYRPREDRQNVNLSFIGTVQSKIQQPDKEVTQVKWFPLSSVPNEKELAFDHHMMITKYILYKKKSFKLPILL